MIVDRFEPGLGVATAKYPENESGGLLIVGYNWGRSKEDIKEPNSSSDEVSFFSDRRVNEGCGHPNRFALRLSDWFKLWGHELRTTVGEEGAFERSIAQTNWLLDVSSDLQGRNYVEQCIEGREGFFDRLSTLRPRLLVFCGIRLISVLNHKTCLPMAERILGERIDGPHHFSGADLSSKPAGRQFKFAIQQFGNCDVIAIPHPTGSKGVKSAYIQAFREKIGPIVDRYRKRLLSRTD